MKLALFILTFGLSIGLAWLGLISSYRLKKLNASHSSSLFYMDAFLTGFGFYGIWSYLFFQFLFKNINILEDILPNLLGIFPILGIPLLMVAWYLFIQFCVELIGMKISGWQTIIYFSILIIALFVLGIHYKNQIHKQETIDLILLFRILVLINLFFLFTGGIVLTKKSRQKVNNMSLPLIWGIQFAPFMLFSISLFMVSSHWIFTILLIMFYFSAIAMLPTWLYFKLGNTPIPFLDFEEFCKSFDISKRETEIIQEICQGKTNKEIADSLFITLQTVKDHTHRIYLKTGVSNRVQLTNLVNETTKPGPISN